MNVNAVAISGNLTKDSELQYTQSGLAVLHFRLAVNERRKSQRTGEWEDNPCFVSCVLFGKYGESMQRYLAKGTKAFVQGRLSYREWQKDDERRSMLEVVVERVDVAPRGQVAQTAQGSGNVLASGSGNVVNGAPAVSTPPDAGVYDEDIPF